MKKYVLGFLFSPNLKRVVLIEKTKPEWQAGRLNGVGGKIEWGEVPLTAVRREFYEETNVYINDWEPVDEMSGDGWHVSVFATASDQIEWATTKTEERVFVVNVDAVKNIGELENVPDLIEKSIITLWCKVGFCD